MIINFIKELNRCNLEYIINFYTLTLPDFNNINLYKKKKTK